MRVHKYKAYVLSYNVQRESELSPVAAYSVMPAVGHSRPEHKPQQLCQHSQTETGDFYIL